MAIVVRRHDAMHGFTDHDVHLLTVQYHSGEPESC